MLKYHVYFLGLVGLYSFRRFQKDQWEFWREVIHSISLLSMSSSFPLYALRMTPFRHPGQPCGLRMWAKDVTLTHKHLLRASSHVPLGRVTHHPCFVKRCDRQSDFRPGSHYASVERGLFLQPEKPEEFLEMLRITLAPCVLQGCANATSTFMLIWGLRLCIWTLWVSICCESDLQYVLNTVRRNIPSRR